MRCRGSLIPDLAGGLAGLGVLGLIMIGAAAEGRSQARAEMSTVSLDLAQNFLNDARRGLNPPLPRGWQCTRIPTAGGLLEVRLHGPGFELATLVPATIPEKP